MFKDASDEKLVEWTLSDKPEAFGEIVRRWERKIFALCFGMLGREDEAQDAAQDTFIAAYRNLSNFRNEAKVSSWLHRIAVNQCLTKKRRAKTRGETALDGEDGKNSFAAPAHLSPARQTERNERLIVVRTAVAALPPDLRQVIVMKEFEELTFQEMAEILQLPVSTVKSRVYTALKQLKMRLEKLSLETV